MSGYQPSYRHASRVPWCSEDCPQHDGKRCSMLGMRPGTICEPAVEEMAERIEQLEQAAAVEGVEVNR